MNSSEELMADPIVVFFAGAFVGLVLGPQLLRTGRALLEERSHEIAAIAIDRIMNALKSDLLTEKPRQAA